MQMLTLTSAKARLLGADAFVFGFPLLLMTATMRAAVGENGTGPNRYVHLRRFPDPSTKTIVGANTDTLYSLAWLDLGSRPLLLGIPDTGGRHYLISLLDAWTNAFASFAPRRFGGGGARLAIVGPGWRGRLPEGTHRIHAPTNVALEILHLHAHGRGDLEASLRIQEQLTMAPLDAPGPAVLADSSAVDAPASDPLPAAHRAIMEMDAPRFFAELAAQMRANPAASADQATIDRLAEIGIHPGGALDWAALPEATREGLAAGVEDGKGMVASASASEAEAGWRALHAGADSYGTDYLRRARVANFAFGASRPEDAVFPLSTTDSAGRPLSGAHCYRLCFDAGELPHVDGIWSLAVYDMDQLLVSNPIDRYALGSRDDLALGADGSLEIIVQRVAPSERKANWLPAPDGDFYLMLHLYEPDERVLGGAWAPPSILRTD
jgi:hypothetical protein